MNRTLNERIRRVVFSGLASSLLVVGLVTIGATLGVSPAGAVVASKPIVGMAATPDGGGYWLVASDGGIFTFGDAVFHGSTGGEHLNAPITGMATTPTGGGYWLQGADGE